MTELGIAIEPPSFGTAVMKHVALRLEETGYMSSVFSNKRLLMEKLHVTAGVAEHIRHSSGFSDTFREKFLNTFGFDLIQGYRWKYWQKKGIKF